MQQRLIVTSESLTGLSFYGVYWAFSDILGRLDSHAGLLDWTLVLFAPRDHCFDCLPGPI